ncbi:P-loop containing nucleoside triphosphate hydrolase protein [Infundibulicybe gibba]|nr:P-loop containing nucleoside triphosphate hydrolase protein [Infundibulicybe gibba]
MDSDSNGHQPSSKTTPLLELRGVTCSRDNLPVFQEVNIVVDEGDILVLQGKSGSGKTTLLKCISHLVLYDGLVLYHGSTPKKHGVPTYRSRVLYVPQRPPLLPGTPRDFLSTISTLKSRQSKRTTDTLEHAINISNSWGVDTQLWDREWSNLSGGETQRIALAVAIGLNTAEILLLDANIRARSCSITAGREILAG